MTTNRHFYNILTWKLEIIRLVSLKWDIQRCKTRQLWLWPHETSVNKHCLGEVLICSLWFNIIWI